MAQKSPQGGGERCYVSKWVAQAGEPSGSVQPLALQCRGALPRQSPLDASPHCSQTWNGLGWSLMGEAEPQLGVVSQAGELHDRSFLPYPFMPPTSPVHICTHAHKHTSHQLPWLLIFSSSTGQLLERWHFSAGEGSRANVISSFYN